MLAVAAASGAARGRANQSRLRRPGENFMSSPPLLSVVIPTWNRARLVCEAVESALAQSPGGVEVIVVDDGSTDGTGEVLARRFGSRVRVLRQASRRGPGAARNAGVREARGHLLAFL